MRFLPLIGVFMLVMLACALPAALAPATATPSASATAAPGATMTGIFGAPATFATHAERSRLDFLWGPSDGQFGAIPAG